MMGHEQQERIKFPMKERRPPYRSMGEIEWECRSLHRHPAHMCPIPCRTIDDRPAERQTVVDSLNRNVLPSLVGRTKGAVSVAELLKRLSQHDTHRCRGKRSSSDTFGGGTVRSQSAQEPQSCLVLGERAQIPLCRIQRQIRQQVRLWAKDSAPRSLRRDRQWWLLPTGSVTRVTPQMLLSTACSTSAAMSESSPRR